MDARHPGPPQLSISHLVPHLGTITALAVLLHLWGNPASLQQTVTFQPGARLLAGVLLAGAAIGCLIRPRSTRLIDVTAAAMVFKTAVDLPVAPNHQLLLTLLCLAWLIARAVDRFDPRAPANRVIMAARGVFLVAYSFAAFAKLNTSFFDPAASCSVVLLESLLAPFGSVHISETLARTSMFSTAVVELSVPVLLLSHRTRRYGIFLGLAFHGLLTLDPTRHFYDFTGAVALGLVWFLTPEGLVRIRDRIHEEGERPALPRAVAIVVIATLTLLIPVGMADSIVLWVPGVLLVLWIIWLNAAAAASMLERAMAPVTRPTGWTVALLLVPAVLALANGTTPYLELKNVSAWNMYSNLQIRDGGTNHLIIRRTWALSDELSDRIMLPGDEASEYPRGAIRAQLRIMGPGSAQTIIEDDVEAEMSYRDAQELGPFRLRFQTLGPVAAVGPEPCRFVSAM